MKLAHVAVVTPHQAGLYETTRDIVAAERALGAAAVIYDPMGDSEGIDREVPFTHRAELVNDCDLLVNHSGLSKELNGWNKPIIHVLHGRPYSSFLLTQSGKIPVLPYWQKIIKDSRFKAFVTFWPEFAPYFRLFFGDKLRVLPPPVDLQAWSPDGPRGYGFHGHRGEINVVVTDIWRDDKDPWHVINAFLLFAETHQGAKLHIYAAPQQGQGWQVYLDLLRARGCLGEVCGFVRGLDNVYRAADMLITPHRIATRSVREALACGCRVVMGGGGYTPYVCEPEDIELYAKTMARACVADENYSRRVAEYCFDARATGQEMIELAGEILDG